MAKQPIKRSQSEIDPMFYIPEGVDELVYSDGAESLYLDADEEESAEESFVGEDDYGDYTEGPDVPEIIGVVSQTLRTTAAGTQVVDLVIEVDDALGISKYETRVTKL